ncbi:hypothetical protein JHK82_015977 [Glycine max]|nr:hypothetical protein JHK85_016373 [Glycine max]KAG5046594.1 hypothetical protein JHK86_016000 [Glycine max]KAG5149096.1 hypothetical protein JHK82_015977 [Glycine max]
MRQRVGDLLEETTRQKERHAKNEEELSKVKLEFKSLKSYVNVLITIREKLFSSEKQFRTIERLFQKIDKNRKLIRLKDLSIAFCFVVVVFLFNNLGLCCSLNEEGNALLKLRQKIMSDSFGALSNWVDDEAFVDPCNWFGVECSDGRVVVSNLKDLCLGRTLAPKFVKLINIKSMVNMLQYFEENSFSGTIPEGFVELKELVVLDLGYNNFSGHLLVDLGSNISLAIILLDNNEFLVGLSPEINELRMLSECQADENQLTNGAKMSACTERVTTCLEELQVNYNNDRSRDFTNPNLPIK